MLDLPDDWVWDFWLADDGERHHAFFLHAPRSLGDPDRRHRHARVGHATSTDLVTWERLPDALGPGEAGRFDDLAIWTGCVVRGDDGRWRMFYSALSRAGRERVQRVGLATSTDLETWTRSESPQWPLSPDPRWYAVPDEGGAGASGGPAHWRDPWVVRDEVGTWHMYLTARERDRPRGGGCVGHAVSTDLETWRVGPPVGPATGRFDQLEVVSTARVEGRWVAVFSCLAPQVPGAPDGAGGTWVVEADGPGARLDLGRATRLTDERLYVARLVRARSGEWCLLAFRHRDDHGRFVGGVIDPVPVRWDDDTRVLKGFSPNPGVASPASLV